MTPPLIRIYEDQAALFQGAADFFCRSLAERQQQLAVALSGGSTPKGLYQLLASADYSARLPLDRLHWFWGDERFVAHTDSTSNYRMAREALLDRLDISSAMIHPIPTDDTPESSTERYEALLRQYAAAAEPLFDLMLLGLGDNGHTASLFPGSKALHEHHDWAVAVRDVEKEPPYVTRISLTYPAIANSRHIAFLVSGAGKRDAVERILLRHDASLPATQITTAGTITWLLDLDAAGDVQPS